MPKNKTHQKQDTFKFQHPRSEDDIRLVDIRLVGPVHPESPGNENPNRSNKLILNEKVLQRLKKKNE